MPFWDKGKPKDVKMPVWINPKLHKRVKVECLHRDISMRAFVESALFEELNKPVRK